MGKPGATRLRGKLGVMRRLLVAAVVVAMLGGGMGGAFAAKGAGPGPNGHNNFGLCNAYFEGSQQGQAEKQAHGVAFIALAATATAWDAANDQNESSEPNNETTQEKVAEYCAANGTRP
jgi:hypothetical protein